MFASQKKNLSELIFWFGGRVQSQYQLNPDSQNTNTMYIVAPPKLEKQYLFLSPLLTMKEVPDIIQKLSENGISVLDIQKIDFQKLEYDSG